MTRAFLGALFLTAALPALAAEPPDVSVPFQEYRLPNGLQVLLHEDHRLPVVAVNVWYHVGAVNEQPGRTGFAHLFEHMMFQGSKNVGDDQHIATLERLGASELNGTTNFDRTNYYQVVPSHQLETVLWLESDRMGYLLDTLSQKQLATQQEVVKNERRQRFETSPYGLATEKLWQSLFPAPHPYYGSVIGSMADLDAATVQDVQDFFRKWYAPANATLAIAGDFQPAQVKALVEKYFGGLSSAPKPAQPELPPVELSQELVVRHDEKVATLPGLFLGWHSPRLFAAGDADADILSAILSHGKASRLYQRLVHQKQLATSVSAYQQSLGQQSVFGIQATARPGVTTDQLLSEIDAALKEVREKGVSQAEVDRARNRIQTSFVSGLQSNNGKADQLQSYNHFLGKPGGFEQDLARYDAVTPEKVKQFTKTYLTPARVVIHAVPGEGQKPSAEVTR